MRIPTNVHGGLCSSAGVTLIAAPWLVGLAEFINALHVVFGLLEISVIVLVHGLLRAAPGTVKDESALADRAPWFDDSPEVRISDAEPSATVIQSSIE